LHERDNIAIVGTRNCSPEGKLIAQTTAKRFAEKGYNIVSGLAEGIDTAAHQGALMADGKTTAVLVDVEKIFPEKNKPLSEEILINNGLLIAENPPNTIPAGHLFVSRDRLQSGLSLAVFPIETDVKGGTMHTVRFSEKQNRLLFVPDLKKIDGYDTSFDKARGILELSNLQRAQTYTKHVYNDIDNQLESKKKELYSNYNKEGSEETSSKGNDQIQFEI
jgi:Predicted Rossmann fold nucleotide-binding protein involved in DNA uptake